MRMIVGTDLEIYRDQMSFVPIGAENETYHPPKQYHMTLNYIGDVDRDDIRDIQEDIQKIEHKPFDVVADTLFEFPNKRDLPLYALGFSEPSELRKLHEKTSHILGVEPSENFFPHVTLLKPSRFVPHFEGEIKKHSNIDPILMGIDSVELFQTDSPNGHYITHAMKVL